MDSFVLSETFKYLFLLFANEDELGVPIDEYVFTTEAHIIPLKDVRVAPILARVSILTGAVIILISVPDILFYPIFYYTCVQSGDNLSAEL